MKSWQEWSYHRQGVGAFGLEMDLVEGCAKRDTFSLAFVYPDRQRLFG